MSWHLRIKPYKENFARADRRYKFNLIRGEAATKARLDLMFARVVNVFMDGALDPNPILPHL
jgi:hypothetical protein